MRSRTITEAAATATSSISERRPIAPRTRPISSARRRRSWRAKARRTSRRRISRSISRAAPRSATCRSSANGKWACRPGDRHAPAHGRRANSAGWTAVAALRSRPAACYPHGIRDFHQSILMTAAHSPIKGIALGFLAYFLFSCSDANVKALGGQLPVFEIGFFSTLFAALVLLFLKPRDERWRDAIRMRRPGLVALRGVAGATAGILGIYAFTTLPFAEAYALIFLSPSIATILSIFLLSEQVGWRRWTAVGIGFAGVLAIVRPGFETLELGHLAAFAVSFCAAGGHHPAHAGSDRAARQPAGCRDPDIARGQWRADAERLPLAGGRGSSLPCHGWCLCRRGAALPHPRRPLRAGEPGHAGAIQPD